MAMVKFVFFAVVTTAQAGTLSVYTDVSQPCGGEAVASVTGGFADGECKTLVEGVPEGFEIPESVKLECSDALIRVNLFSDGTCQQRSSVFDSFKIDGAKVDRVNNGECVTVSESPRYDVRITGDFQLKACGSDMTPAPQVEHTLSVYTDENQSCGGEAVARVTGGLADGECKTLVEGVPKGFEIPESVKLECDTENPSDALIRVNLFADGTCQQLSSVFDSFKIDGAKVDRVNNGECVTVSESPRYDVQITGDFRLNACGTDMNPASRVGYALVLLGLLMVLNLSASF